MKKIASIDLETLDVRSTGVILEIGIVVGDDQGKVIEQFRMYPDIQEQIDQGRSVSASTILWWFEQDESVRMLQKKAKRHSYTQVCDELHKFLAKHKDMDLMLGNAPSFDCDMLASFLGEKPWPFYIERDVRTARMAVPVDQRYPNTQAHDALADAMAQYRDFVSFLSLRN